MEYPFWKLALIAILVALPIMAKNLLGAIPAAAFFILLLIDHKNFSKKFWQALAFFVSALAVYYLPLYFASPTAFKQEILVPFFHFQNLEGWGRPWYFYLTNYLPQRYLFRWTWWLFYAGLIFSLVYSIKYIGDRETKILVRLSLLWFVWNLIAVSLVQSKIANFIFQSYLLSLFGIVLSTVAIVFNHFEPLARNLWLKLRDLSPSPRFARSGSRWLVLLFLICAVFLAGRGYYRLFHQFKIDRSKAYPYNSEHEKFYQTAEKLEQAGVGTKDLTVVHVNDHDCWLRYYILFLTGAESKTLLEVNFNLPPAETIKQKYDRVFYISSDGIKQIDPNKLNTLVADNQKQIQQDILRIKKDKTSCQWLVPDSVLSWWSPHLSPSSPRRTTRTRSF